MMPSNELAASVQPPNEVNNLEEGRRVEIIDDDNENQPVPFGDMVEADRRSEAEYLKAREYHNNNAIATATATLSTQNRPNSDMSLDFNEIAHPTSSPNQSSFISDLARRQSSGDTNMARADSTQTSAAIPASRSTQYQPRHSSPLVATLVQNVEEATLIRQPTIYNATIAPDTPPPSAPRPSRFSVNPLLRRLFQYDDNEHDNPNNNDSSAKTKTKNVGTKTEKYRHGTNISPLSYTKEYLSSEFHI